MTQTRIYFNEYTVGATPADWTPRWVTANQTWAVRSGKPSPDGVTLEHTATSGSARVICTYNALDNYTGDFDMLTRWKSDDASGANILSRIMACMSGTATSSTHNSYHAYYDAGSATFKFGRYVNGTFTVLAEPAFAGYVPNTWYWYRLRRRGNVFSANMWQDGTAEPAFIISNITDATHTTGWYGVGAATNIGTRDFDYFSVGTGVDVAPFPMVALAADELDANSNVTNKVNIARPLAATLKAVGKLIGNVTVSVTPPNVNPLAATLKAKGKLTAALTVIPQTSLATAQIKAATRATGALRYIIGYLNAPATKSRTTATASLNVLKQQIIQEDRRYIFCYDRTEQLVCALNNGSQEACPFYDAILHEVLNGEFTFSFSVPYDYSDAKLIPQDGYVIVKDITDAWQLFCITQIEDNHGDEATRTVFCEQAQVELLDEIIESLTISVSSSAFEALTNILNGTRWAVGNVTDTTTNSTVMKFENIDRKEALQQFRQRYRGDIKYRTDVIGTTFYRYVDFAEITGVFTGRRFEYAKDLQEITREIDTSAIKTAIIGVGGKPDQESAAINFENVVWTVAGGDPIEKPSGFRYVADPIALALWGRVNGAGARKHLWGFHFSDTTDPEQLLYDSYTLLMKNNAPKVRYTVKVIDLSRLIGEDSELLRLGDSVNIIDRDLAIQIEARILERNIDFNSLERSSVVLGQFRESFVDSVNDQPSTTIPPQAPIDLSGYLQEGDPIDTAWLTGAIDALRNQINAGGGTVTINDTDGVLVENTGKTKAIKLQNGILAIANSKVNNVYQWTTFGTGDGFTANLINAGTIQTNLITIQSANDANFFWNQALLKAVNPSNSQQLVALGKLATGRYGLGFSKDGGTTWSIAIDHTGLKSSQFNIDINGNASFSGSLAAGISISAPVITGGTISAATWSGGNINNGTLAAATINGGTITGGTINGGQINGTAIQSDTTIRIGDSNDFQNLKSLVFSSGAVIQANYALPVMELSSWRIDLEASAINIGAQTGTVNTYFYSILDFTNVTQFIGLPTAKFG